MRAFKFVAGFFGLACGLAVATAVSGFNPKVTKVIDTLAVKGDRLNVATANNFCRMDAWPYGCEWRAPERTHTTPRASGSGKKYHVRRHTVTAKPTFVARFNQVFRRQGS